jgi:hypothetical protein
MWSEEAILIGTAAFIVIAGLSAGGAVYLFLRNGLRFHKRTAPPCPPSPGFDTSSVSPRLERVRLDYVAALHSHPHPAFHARGLLVAARRSISCFHYFQAKTNEPAAKAEAEIGVEE